MSDGDILRMCREEGFNLVGCAPAEPAPEREAEFHEWLEGGCHGEMRYLEGHAEAKFRPEELLSGARSVIMVAVNYHQTAGEATGAPEGPTAPDEKRGKISLYAWGRDYHKVLGSRLRRIVRRLSEQYPAERFRRFVDTLPIAERYYGARAGIGFIGRNTLLITEEYGSWVFLGGILTTLPTEAVEGTDGLVERASGLQCPPDCRRCVDACPTGALYAPFRIDARRCISYRTIEATDMGLYDRPDETPDIGRGGEEGDDVSRRTGRWLFGCDVCQKVCPFNRGRPETKELDFRRWIAGPELSLGELLDIRDRDGFVQRFAGSPLMRAGLSGMRRNARIVEANHASRRE